MTGKSQIIKKWLLLTAGTISVVAGVIGIVIPILPTTPFLLLAAICYMHSSERLYIALTRNRVCGCYIRNYLEGRGMHIRAKILTLALLWLIIGVTIGLVVSGLWIKIVLLSAGIGVTIHLSLIHTLSNNYSTGAGEEHYRLKNK